MTKSMETPRAAKRAMLGTGARVAIVAAFAVLIAVSGRGSAEADGELVSALGGVETYRYELTFHTEDQGLWGPDAGATPEELVMDLPGTVENGRKWDRDVGVGSTAEQTILGETVEFGAKGGLFSQGRLDISAKLALDPGTVDVDARSVVYVRVPKADSFRAGDTITISTEPNFDPRDFGVLRINTLTSDFPGGRMQFGGNIGLESEIGADLCMLTCDHYTVVDLPTLATALNFIPSVDSSGNFSLGDGPVAITSQDSITIPDLAELVTGVGGTFGLPSAEALGIIHVPGKVNGTVFQFVDTDFIDMELDIDTIVGHFVAIPVRLEGDTKSLPDIGGISIPGLNVGSDDAEAAYTILDYTEYTQFSLFSRMEFEVLEIMTQLDFPLPLQYTVRDTAGNVVDSGFSAHVEFPVGHSLDIEVPEDLLEPIQFTPTFSISDNRFQNETSIELDQNMERTVGKLSFECCSIDNDVLSWDGLDVDWGPAQQINVYETRQVYDLEFNGGVHEWQLGGFSPITETPITLDPNEPPVAVIDAPTSVGQGQGVLFSSAGSTDANGDGMMFEWDLGDGTVIRTGNIMFGFVAQEAETQISHLYQESGQYTVKLTAWDTAFASDVATHVINVDVGPPSVASVGFHADTAAGVLEEGTAVGDAAVTQLSVTFSEPMPDPTGHTALNDVSNPSAYQLVAAGANGLIDAVPCIVTDGGCSVVEEYVQHDFVVQVLDSQYGQSFTPQWSGALTRIAVLFDLVDEEGSYTLRLFSGGISGVAPNASPGGTLLTEQSVSLLPGWNEFVLDTPQSVSAGSEYTFQIVGEGRILAPIVLQSPGGSSYPGGRAFQSALSDYPFRTQMLVDSTEAPFALFGGDTPVAIQSVSYDDATRTATLSLSAPLNVGNYGLFVGGHGALADVGGNALDGDGDGRSGDAFLRKFSITTAPPAVSSVGYVVGSEVGTLPDNAKTDPGQTPITKLTVTFDSPVSDPEGDIGPHDVTNPANYLLVGSGQNKSFDTVLCLFTDPCLILDDHETDTPIEQNVPSFRQRFTARVTGGLQQIHVQVNWFDPERQAILDVQDITQAVVHSQPINLTNGLNVLNLTSPVPVTANNIYYFRIRYETGSSQIFGTQLRSYAVCGDGGGFTDCVDLFYKTYVTPSGASGSVAITGADDALIAIDSVTYDPDTLTATLEINGGAPLPAIQTYALYVRGGDGILDALGAPLDADGDGEGGDVFVRVFDVTDLTPPVMTLPGSVITVEATELSPLGIPRASYSYGVTAVDQWDAFPSVWCSPPSGWFQDTTVVNCVATDSRGNRATGSFDVTVVDTTPPTFFSVPSGIAKEAVGSFGAWVFFDKPTAFDLPVATPLGGATTFALVLCSIPDGTLHHTGSDVEGLFPVGTTTVTCVADDGRGNTAVETFDVVVQDAVAPSLSLPGTLTVEAQGPDGVIVSYTAAATDSVDAALSISCDSPSGSLFPLGSTTVTCTATDASGNNAVGSFQVNVLDRTAPAFIPPDTTFIYANSTEGATYNFTTSASDLVDPAPEVSCNLESGSLLPIGATTVTCTARDASGNVTIDEFVVTVELNPVTSDLRLFPFLLKSVDPEVGTVGQPVRFTFESRLRSLGERGPVPVIVTVQATQVGGTDCMFDVPGPQPVLLSQDFGTGFLGSVESYVDVTCTKEGIRTIQFTATVSLDGEEFREVGLGDETLTQFIGHRFVEPVDLELSSFELSSVPSELTVGEPHGVGVNLVARNNGDSFASAVVGVHAMLPDGCSVDGPSSQTTAVDLAPGESAALSLTFALGCSEPGLHDVEFTAEISPSESFRMDVSEGNDEAAKGFTVAAIGHADGAAIRIHAQAAPVIPGEETMAWVTLTVANHGPLATADFEVALTAAAPAGCSITPTGASEVLSVANGTEVGLPASFRVQCSQAGEQVFDITGTVQPVSQYVLDSNEANDVTSFQFVLDVLPPADLEVVSVGVDEGQQVEAGVASPVALTAVVRNNGPEPLVNAIVDFGFFTTFGGGCTRVGAFGQSVPISIEAGSEATVHALFEVQCDVLGPRNVTAVASAWVADGAALDVEPVNDSNAGTGTVTSIAHVDVRPETTLFEDVPEFLEIGELGTFFVTVQVTYDGAYGPIEVEVSGEGVAPEGCELGLHARGSVGSPGFSFQWQLEAGVTDTISFIDYALRCDVPGLHTLTFTVNTTPTNAYVRDTDETNDSVTVTLDVFVKETADGEIVDLSVIGPATVDEGDEVEFPVEVSVVNNGPSPSVGFLVTISASASGDCALVGPDDVSIPATLPKGSPQVLTTAFTARCPDEGTANIAVSAAIWPVSDEVEDLVPGNETGAAQHTVVVNNAAPVAVSDSTSVTVDEGDTAANGGSFSDVGVNDTVTITASIGTITHDEGAAGGWTWQFDAADGPSTSVVIITATDSDGASSSVDFGLVVNNVAPTVDAGPDRSATAGEPLTVSATFTDPGVPDTHTAIVDWGDGQTETIANVTSPIEFTHEYADAGDYLVTVEVTDSDGESASAVFTVDVKLPLPIEYALFATGEDSLTVDQNAEVNGGRVGSNGSVEIKQNAEAGDVVAADVVVSQNATVGDVTASGSVRFGRNSTMGTITVGTTIPEKTLPEVDANPDPSRDIVRTQRQASAGPLELEPGRYGKLVTANNDRIVLRGGEYHFSSWEVKNNVQITVDLSNGQPLVIRIAGGIQAGNNFRLVVVGGDASDVLVMAGGDIIVGNNGSLAGSFAAPNGLIDLGRNVELIGAAWGSEVHVGQNGVVTHVPYDGGA